MKNIIIVTLDFHRNRRHNFTHLFFSLFARNVILRTICWMESQIITCAMIIILIIIIIIIFFPFLHSGRKLWKSMSALISIRGRNLSSSENWNTWNEFSSTYFYFFFAASNLYFRVGSHETLFTQAFEKLIIPFVTNIRSTVHVSLSKCKLLLYMYMLKITYFTDLSKKII